MFFQTEFNESLELSIVGYANEEAGGHVAIMRGLRPAVELDYSNRLVVFFKIQFQHKTWLTYDDTITAEEIQQLAGWLTELWMKKPPQASRFVFQHAPLTFDYTGTFGK